MTHVDLKLLSEIRAAALQAEANGFEETAQKMREIGAQLLADFWPSTFSSKSGLSISDVTYQVQNGEI
jgi:hypothetical protein